jgi:WD40 repeat protein
MFAVAGLGILATTLAAGLLLGGGSHPLPAPTARPASLPLVIRSGFTGGTSVWDSDTGSWRRLTNGFFMAIAPDGSWFGYREDCSDLGCPIWIAALDGTEPARLAYASAPHPNTPENQWLAESPDGRAVVREGPGVLEIVGLEGGPAAWTSSDPLPLRVIEVPQISGPGSMAWSPDSRTVGVIGDDGDIYIVDVVSGGVQRITDTGAFVAGRDYAPALDWSHDGTRILTTDADRRVWLVAVHGGDVQPLDLRLMGKGVSWSTDDSRIGYESGYLTLADGTTQSLDGAPGGCDTGPLWSGTTNQLAAIIDGALVTSPDASPKVLGTDLCDEGTPGYVLSAWSPDEAWIAVAAIYGRSSLFPVVGGEPSTLIPDIPDGVSWMYWPAE